MKLAPHARLLSLVACCLLAAPFAQAQSAPPPPDPGMPAAPPHPGQAPSGHRQEDRTERRIVIRNGGSEGTMGILPPGTWWKSPETVKDLNLTVEQQKRLDETFRQNRIQLVRMHASLEEAQINLEPLLNANPPDTNKAMAEISKIADMRAELEKTNAKMLLGMRTILTSDQWTKLQANPHRHGGIEIMHRDGPGGALGPMGDLDLQFLPDLNLDGLGALSMPEVHIAPIDIAAMTIPSREIPPISIPAMHFEAAGKPIDIPRIDIPAITIPQIKVPAVHTDGMDVPAKK